MTALIALIVLFITCVIVKLFDTSIRESRHGKLIVDLVVVGSFVALIAGVIKLLIGG